MNDYALYRLATRYLESFIRETGLRRVRHLLARLGDPHNAYNTVHVGGTSGKGSTCAAIGAALRAAGRRTGLHATPYLQTQLEKFEIDGRFLAPGPWADLVDELRPHVNALIADPAFGPPHYGELSVALTYLAFARAGVEWAVIEVGMGGRLDLTNVITPRVAAITTVGYDHTRALGPTIAEIAHHKAGIIKPGRPVVVGALEPEAMAIVAAEARRQGAPLRRAGDDFRVRLRPSDGEGTTFDYESTERRLAGLRVAMLGAHQARNAGLAVAALECVWDEVPGLDEASLRHGLARARLPGRLEVVQHRPTVVLDGAHNHEKVGALAAALDDLFPGRVVRVVLGVVESKDAEAMIERLGLRANSFITTEAGVAGRAAIGADFLADLARSRGLTATAIPSPEVAVAAAISASGADDVVVVTGSLYLVGRARGRWFPEERVVAEGASGVAAPHLDTPPKTTI